jgi:hypothetical protein
MVAMVAMATAIISSMLTPGLALDHHDDTQELSVTAPAPAGFPALPTFACRPCARLSSVFSSPLPLKLTASCQALRR